MMHNYEDEDQLLFQGVSHKPVPSDDSPALSPQEPSPQEPSPVNYSTIEEGALDQMNGSAVAVDHPLSDDDVSVAVKQENVSASDEDEGDNEDPQHAPIADTSWDWQGQGLEDLGLHDELSVIEQMCDPVNWANMGSSNAMTNDTAVQMPATAAAYADQMSTDIPQFLPGYHDPSLNSSYLDFNTPCTWPTSTYQQQQGQTFGGPAQYVGGTYPMAGGDQWVQYIQPSNNDGINVMPIYLDNNNCAPGNYVNHSIEEPALFNGTDMQPPQFNFSKTTNSTPWEVSTLAHEALMRTENKLNTVLEHMGMFKELKELNRFIKVIRSFNASTFGHKSVPQCTSPTLESSSFEHRRTARSPGRIPKLVRNPPPCKQGDSQSVKQIIAAYDEKLKADQEKTIDVAQSTDCTTDNMELDDKPNLINPTDPEDSMSISSPAPSTATLPHDDVMEYSGDGGTSEKTIEKTRDVISSNKHIWKYFITRPSNPKPNNIDFDNSKLHARLLAQSNLKCKPWNGVLHEIEAVSGVPFSEWDDITGTRDDIYDLFNSVNIPGVSVEMCKLKNQDNIKFLVFIPPFDANGKDYDWVAIQFSFIAMHVRKKFVRYNVYNVDVEIWETNIQLVVI